jgi:hypothetical protein
MADDRDDVRNALGPLRLRLSDAEAAEEVGRLPVQGLEPTAGQMHDEVMRMQALALGSHLGVQRRQRVDAVCSGECAAGSALGLPRGNGARVVGARGAVARPPASSTVEAGAIKLSRAAVTFRPGLSARKPLRLSPAPAGLFLTTAERAGARPPPSFSPFSQVDRALESHPRFVLWRARVHDRCWWCVLIVC